MNQGSSSSSSSNQKAKCYALVLKISASIICLLAIANIVIGNYNLITSYILDAIFILLFVFMFNSLMGAFLIMSLFYSSIPVLTFFGLKIQNSIMKIYTFEDQYYVARFIINLISLVVFMVSIIYTYFLSMEILYPQSNTYNELGNVDTFTPNENNNNNINSINQSNINNTNVNNSTNNTNNFTAFTGQGKKLDD